MRTRSKYLKFSVNNEGKILIQHDFYKYFDDKHDCEYKVFIIYGNKIFPELDYEECTNKKDWYNKYKIPSNFICYRNLYSFYEWSRIQRYK